jgi:hypothetical protein
MLSRQMLFRLDCMMDDEEPSRSGILAERILLSLSRVPTSFNSPHLVKTILGLPSGLAVIDDEERLVLRDLAYLTDDGLHGAIQELARPPERPISPRDLLAIRVALVILSKALRGGPEVDLAAWKNIWEKQGHGLAFHLIDSLSVLASDVATYFSLNVPSSASSDHIGNLFGASNELICQLKTLLPVHLLPSRALASLLTAICDLFACMDAADIRFSPGSDTSIAAQRSRQGCIDLARMLVQSKEGKAFIYAEPAFRSLLRHASNYGSRDPAYHVVQVFGLIDYLLPMPHEDAIAVDQEELAVNWVTPIIPRVLPDLTAFFRILDPESRAHFMLRIGDIDDGAVGIGEWLFMDELKRLHSAASAVSPSHGDNAFLLLKFYEIVASFKLLHHILAIPTPCATRLVEYTVGEPEPAGTLTAAINALLSKRLFAPLLLQVSETFISVWLSSCDASLRFTLALVFLRGVQHQDESVPLHSLPSLLKNAMAALEGVSLKSIEPERLCAELRDALLTLATLNSPFNTATANATLAVLDWLVQHSHAGLPQLATLRGISTDTLGVLLDRLAAPLDATALDRLDHIRERIATPGEDALVAPSTLLPTSARMSVDTLDAALRAHILPPATPKRTTPPHAQNALSLVTVSPPTALLRSPAVTGLTKMYAANDFRVLRQTPSTRQNTSRMPSMHVDVSHVLSIGLS